MSNPRQFGAKDFYGVRTGTLPKLILIENSSGLQRKGMFIIRTWSSTRHFPETITMLISWFIIGPTPNCVAIVKIG